jgi:hypothetical protein
MSAPVGIDDEAAGAVLCHVVPLLVRRFPLVEGATKLGVEVPFPNITLFAVRVVAPVPPLATESVPVWSLRAKEETKTLALPAAFPTHILPSAAFSPSSPAASVGVLVAV